MAKLGNLKSTGGAKLGALKSRTDAAKREELPVSASAQPAPAPAAKQENASDIAMRRLEEEAARRNYAAQMQQKSRVGAGNVDLYNRPQYRNADGSISTVDSRGYNIDGKETLLPSVWMKDGKPYHSQVDDEILQHYYDTGEYLGKFDTVDEANDYAERLHRQQEAFYAQDDLAKLAEETVQQPEFTHRSGKIPEAEPEKQSFWRRLFPSREEIAKANAAAAEYQAKQYTDDTITPIEAAALGAARTPASVSTLIGKGITKLTKDESDDQRLQDYYTWQSGLQQQAQETQPAAFGAGQIVSDVALMNAISSVVSPAIGKAADALTTARVGVNGAEATMRVGKTAQMLINGAARAASSAATFGSKEAITQAGSAAMGDLTGGEYAKGIAKSAASGLAFYTVSSVLSAGGTEILRGLNNRAAGGIDWTAPFAWFTKEVIAGMGGASASIGLDYATASPTKKWLSEARNSYPQASEDTLKEIYKEQMKKDLGKQFLMMFFFTVIGAAKSTSEQLEATRSVMDIVKDRIGENFEDEDFLRRASGYSQMTPEEQADFVKELVTIVDRSEAQLDSLFGGKGYYGVGLNEEGKRIYSALENLRSIASADIPVSGTADSAAYGEQLMTLIGDTPTSATPQDIASYAAASVTGIPENRSLQAAGDTAPAPQDTTAALMELAQQMQEEPAAAESPLPMPAERGNMTNDTTVQNVPAESEKTASTEETAPASLEPIAETLGSSGQKAILNAYDGETQTDVYAKEFLNVYNAAQNGGKLPETNALTGAQRFAAEAAGRNDAALTAQTIKEDMTYGGREETGEAGAAGDNGTGEGSMGLQSQRPAVEAGRVDEGAAAAGAGNPVGAEAQGAGGNRPEVRGGAKDREVSESLTLDGVSDAASLGIENGDTTQKVRLVESGSSPAMKNAEKIARKSGHKITPFVGGYLAAGENKSIQAASMPNGDILAAADDPEFEMDRLAGHEVCEDEIRKGDVSVKDAIRTVREKVGDEKVNRVLDAYRSLHYDEKELVCDAAGNMNRLAAYEDAGGYIAELKGTMDEVLSVLHDYVNVNGAYDDVPALDGYAAHGKAEFSKKSDISKLEEKNERKDIQKTADKGTVRAGNVGDNTLDSKNPARRGGQGNTGRSVRGTSKAGNGRSVRYENLTEAEQYFAHTLLFDPIDNGPELYRSLYEGYSVTNLEKHLYDIFSENTKEFQYLCRQIPELKSGADTLLSYLNGNNANDTILQKTDNTGLDLTKEQYKYFLNSKETDGEGHLKMMFRGGDTDIEVFDRKKSKPSNLFGRGFYFTDSFDHAKQFGNPQGYYLNVTNPIRPGQNNITKAQMRAFLKTVAEDEDYGLENYGYGSTAESVLNDVYGKGDFEMLQDVNASAIGDLVAAIELFNDVNGTDYDGIILPTETIIFKSEQAKKVTNLNPTSSQNVNFSMAAPVEEINKLIALHNMTEGNLRGALELGGLPMPSIAVVRADTGHTKYGPISVVFDKSSIDPRASSLNKVYGSDAWTPTAPQIGYKYSDRVISSMRSKVESIIGADLYRELNPSLDSSNINDKVLRSNGSFAEAYRDSVALKLAYLKEIGKQISVPTMQRKYSAPPAVLKQLAKTIDVEALREMPYAEEIKYEPQVRQALYDYELNRPEYQSVTDNGKTIAQVRAEVMYGKQLSYKTFQDAINDAASIKRYGVRKETDVNKLKARVDGLLKSKKAAADYDAWLSDLSNGLIEKKGIRNNKDPYTSVGNRRSFEALYDEYTLDNIVRAMRGQEERGGQTFGVNSKTLQSVTTPAYGSIAEIRQDSGRLGKLDEGQYEALNKEIDDDLMNAIDDIFNSTEHFDDNRFIEYDNIAEAVIKAARRGTAPEGIVRSFARDGYSINRDIAEMLSDIFKRTKTLPTEYFEAKPQRAVKFDEALAVVVPSDTDKALKNSLQDAGATVLTYRTGDEADRLKKVNSVQGAQFSNAARPEDIKALARMSDKRIDSLIEDSGAGRKKDYAQKWITSINPTDFLNLTLKEESQDRALFDNRPGDYGSTVNDSDYIEFLKKETRQTPFLSISPDGTVAGHEGRHRMRALEKAGVTSAEIAVMFYDDDGRLMKDVNNINGRLETLKQIRIYNQYGTGQMTRLKNVIPMNMDHREEILTSYGERNVSASDVVFSSASTEADSLRMLQQENKRLQKQVDDLRAQLKTTDRSKASFRPGDLTAAARELIRSNSSTMKAEELAQKLEPVYRYIAEGGADGDELTYAGMMERITPVAREIADSAEVMRSTDYDSYKALRDYLKGTKLAISQADRADVNNGDYEGFRKSHFGTMTLGTTGVPVDTAYQELQHIMGTGFFPDDITHPADQLEQIASVMDALRPVAENPFSLDMEEAVNYIADEIADSFFSVRETAPTFADRAKASKESSLARQKENLTANYEDRMTKQEADYEAKIAKQKANMQAAKEAALKRAAQQRADAISKLKTHYAEVNELRRERKQNADARKKLLKLAQRLDRMKTTRANRAVIDEVLKNLDTVSVSMTGKTIDKLSDLLVWYQNKAQTDPDFIRDPGVEAKISRLAKHQIKDLNMEQVRDLTDLLRGIEQGIRTQGRMISVINGKTVYRYDDMDAHMMGLDTIRDIENTRGTKRDLIDWLVTNELSPERFMHRITGYNDSDPLYMATKALSEGQRIMMDYQMRAQKRFQKWMDDKKFIKHIRGDKADTIEITGVQDGKTVTAKITPDMRMALCLHSLNDQNLRHAQTGGVTIPDLDLLNKGKIAEAYERGVTIKLSPSNIRSIISKMSAQEWAYASAARDYFNGMSSDEINAVSEALVGYSIAGVNEYFPINTDTRFSRKEFDTLKKDGTIEGMGFLKERINASNPIMLRGLTDVLNQSIGMHAKYVGLAVPVRNFNLLWNTTASGAPDEEGNRERFTKSVQTVVGGKWGARATDYVEKLMTDLQTSGHPADELDKFFGKVRSNYAGAVLTLNPSVAIKQAASYPTAAAVLGWGPIIKAMKYNGPVDLDLIAKYTPLQWYRGLGYSTQELGDIASRKDSVMNKIMGLSFTVKGYEIAPLNWIQMIDLLTTRKLWKASEIYVKDNQKDLTPGSEDYYRAVAEIYNRVIEETQPNYTTMQRPQILRSDNSLAKSVVNFKTQPFQNFNILYDAFANMQAKHRAWKNTGSEESKKAYDRARKEAGDAFTSQFAAALTFSGMTAAASLLLRRFKHRYGDKNEDVTTGSFFTKFAKDFVGNYASMAIFGTEAYDVASSLVFGDTYYGPDAISVSTISDAATTVLNTWNYIQGVMDDVKEGKKINLNRMRIKLTALAESVSKVFGYPVENVTGMGEAAFRTAAEQIAGKYLGTYAYLRLTKDMESSAKDFYRNLYNAMQNDTGAYEELYAQMVEDGFDEKKIKSYIEGRMKEEQGVEHVSDLDERYMSPAQKRSYNQAERELNRGNVYGKLTGEKREDVEEYISDYATKDSDWKKVLEKFDGYRSVGLDELDILEFLTCRSYQDDPNKNGNLHTYTNEEIEFAIRTMAGKDGNNLTKEQKDFFWIACGKKADKTPKW